MKIGKYISATKFRRFVLYSSFLIIATNAFPQHVGHCNYHWQAIVPINSFNICNENPWTLVFEDNFNGNNLDLSKWVIPNLRIRICNSEQQYYTYGDNNIEVSNGTLKIITKEETIYAKAVDWLPEDTILYCKGNAVGQNERDFYYTSANIETAQRFSYGKFEARIRVPEGKGFWPAFWLYGQNPIYNELDVFEISYNRNLWGSLTSRNYTGVHYDYADFLATTDSVPRCLYKIEGENYSDDFHVYTLIWEPNIIKWYIDGILKRVDYRYYTFHQQITGCYIQGNTLYYLNQVYPQDPMRIILNLAIQKGNAPDNSTTFPNQMEIDWVRYYQRKPCKDEYITDASQFIIDDQTYNVIVGYDVTINCDFTILSGQQLEIAANNSITIGPGFTAEAGSNLSAIINPEICNTIIKNDFADIDNKLTEGYFSEELQTKDKVSDKTNLKIYPNPNEGSFIIDFGSDDFNEFRVVLTNIEGKPIISLNETSSSSIIMDIKDKPKGVYILRLINEKEKTVFTHKIIYQ